jgi:hypothetical protein
MYGILKSVLIGVGLGLVVAWPAILASVEMMRDDERLRRRLHFRHR